MCDDFQLVTSKKKKKNKKKLTNIYVDFLNNPIEREFSTEDLNRVEKKIFNLTESIAESDFVKNLLLDLSTCLKQLKTNSVGEILCYGLGSVTDSVNSKHQLAALLCLKKHFNCPVLLFDPIFTTFDIQLLRLLDCTVIDNNEEGKRDLPLDKHTTLLFLPHCPKQLVNNILWKNWSINLKNCIFLSNSFSKICEITVGKDSESSIQYISEILPYTFESNLQNNYKFSDIFNDIALHVFPVLNVDSSFWRLKEEPIYKDPELISRDVLSKLNII